jgi:hypothetical protein
VINRASAPPMEGSTRRAEPRAAKALIEVLAGCFRETS